MFRDAGVPAPMTAFYRIFIDHGEGPIYFGLYTMVEPPYYPMLNREFGDDGGNLYKPSGTGAKFGVYNQDSFPKHTNVDEEDYSDVTAVFDALHADRGDPEAWRNDLEKVFNVEGFLYWLAANTIMQNFDTYGALAHNYYLYSNPQDGLVHWIPWDNNSALWDDIRIRFALNTIPGYVSDANLSLDLSEVTDEWPLIRYLLDDPEYQETYKSFVDDFAATVFTVSDTKARFKEAHDLIEPYVLGPNGEISGYSLLLFPQTFYNELDYLYTLVEDRQDAVADFLSE
jgi:hypothetical protein